MIISLPTSDYMSAVEEPIFFKRTDLTGTAYLHILNEFINEANIEWKNCIGLCTEGLDQYLGHYKSFVEQTSALCSGHNV